MSKPRTEAQLAAARANGKKSRGPITPMGKRNSSRNAWKHGMFAPIVFPEEFGPYFHFLHSAIWNEVRPRNPLESEVVGRMVTAQWRIRHIQDLEHASMIREYDALGPAPQIVIDGEVYEHRSLRNAIAFESVHGRRRRGSPLQQTQSRWGREYRRANGALAALRKRKHVIFTERPGATH